MLELVSHVVTQWRDFAVFFGRETLQPGVACVHDKHRATGLRHRADKVAHKAIVFVFINTDAVLDRDRHIDHIDHGFDTVGHQHGLVHQAGAKGPALYAFAGAAAVQINLVVAPLRAQTGGHRQVGRLAATQLQGQRMLLGVKAQMPVDITVHERAGGHHFGIQAGVAGEEAVQIAAMAVGPVHHGGDGQAPRAQRLIFIEAHGRHSRR